MAQGKHSGRVPRDPRRPNRGPRTGPHGRSSGSGPRDGYPSGPEDDGYVPEAETWYEDEVGDDEFDEPTPVRRPRGAAAGGAAAGAAGGGAGAGSGRARTSRGSDDGKGGGKGGPRTVTIPLDFTKIIAALAALAVLVGIVAYGLGWIVTRTFAGGSNAASGTKDKGSSSTEVVADPDRFGPCPAGDLNVYADSSISGALGRTLAISGCDNINIQTKPSWAASADITRNNAPDIWVPDSTSWKTRTYSDNPIRPLVPSIATSPVVVASSQPYTARSWRQVFTDQTFQIGNPLSSSSALGVMLSAHREVTPQQWTNIALKAARSSVSNSSAQGTSNRDDKTRLDDIISAQSGVVAVPEQVALQTDGQATISLPPGPTMVLDYPVFNTSPQGRQAATREAREWFKGFVESEDVAKALADQGFRNAQGDEIEGSVGSFQALKLPPQQNIQVLLNGWGTLTIPSKVLVVLDTSGSMAFTVPDGRTRMQVTREVMSKGISYYPDSARIGLWTFSQGIADGGKRDWKQRVPIRTLSQQTPRGTQRQVLVDEFDKIQHTPGGGTGLYDTVLASYENLKNNYNYDAYNWLIFFTDGSNDDPESIDEAALLKKLRSYQGDNKPVVTVFIGITSDADERALNEIAKATGGNAYIIDNPADLDGILAASLGGLS